MVPDRSVIGRTGTGTGSGPSQAIPFATLQAQMGIASQPEFYATAYGVKCDGVTDDSAAAQSAITAAAGAPVVFPSGTCVITATLNYTTSASSFFAQGLQIRGQGREKTIFDSRIANGYLFSVDTQADGKFHSGSIFKDFKITTLAGSPPAASSGIKLHRAAYASFENIQITGISGDGIDIPASAGDPDASFVVSLDHIRMDSVAGWCVNLNAPSGGYFGSNLRVTNSSFQSCGTASASVPPTSGAFQIKGLIAQFENMGFTTNNNVDLYVQGADSSLQITIDGVDFENLKSSVLPHIYVDGGLRGFIMQNSECLNNDLFVAQGCVWFNSAAAPIGNIKIDKVEVRATTNNNSYTAFKATGANTLTDTIRISDIYWQTFDLTGQTRFSGFNFAPISGQIRLAVAGTNSITLTPVGFGASLPIKLASTGEWVNVQLTTGITQAIGPLSANTTYDFYAYNSASANAPYSIVLEANTTAPTVDASGGYNVKTGDSTRTFVGTITTDGSGNFTTSSAASSWYAPQSPVTLSDDTTTNATMFPLWAAATGGAYPIKTSTTKLAFNPSSGTLAATVFSGSGASLTALNASNLGSGTVPSARLGYAAKTDMQTPSSSTLLVPPAQVQNHPGTAKFFARFDGKTGSTCTLKDSYNVASCTRNGTGDYTLTFTTAFADANYAVTGTATNTGTNLGFVYVSSLANVTAGSVRFLCVSPSIVGQDCDFVSVAGYGPQ
ncbi:glycosyl hydrolase family 28-related protein [Bradyrhizobium guangdongense]|uniref:glycosyl hydrolase family 28-related protein n=1 Tax=Bradyrhizobium guangdongense TaxID=1325090 RepID=UPI0013E8A712|nr:glycosyl hydrolase family 28-related protein [Bradyrhizobium guangdongense]